MLEAKKLFCIHSTISFLLEYRAWHKIKIAFDPNIRLDLWCDEDTARSTILEWIPRCNYLKLSDEELIFLTNIAEEETAVEQFLHCGPELIIITKSSHGAVAYANGLRVAVPAFKVNATDSNGAGDSFWGGTISLLAKREAGPFTEEELKTLLRFGCACGALATQKPGAGPAMPYLKEVQTFLESATLA